MLKHFRYLLIVTLFAFMPGASPKDYPGLIIGKWSFESFRFPNYVPADGPEARKWKKMFTGVVYTFTKDKIVCEKKGGDKQFNFSIKYSFGKDNRFIMINGREEFEIDYLDKERLNMYHDGGPVGYFAKIK